jgi:hypothetical protein
MMQVSGVGEIVSEKVAVVVATSLALCVVLRTLANDGQPGLQPVHPFNHYDSKNDYDM